MHYKMAKRIADDLVERMAPFCDRIAIAGSIRRRKAEIGDIELVLIPKWTERTFTDGLFNEEKIIKVNLLHEWAMSGRHPVRWIKPCTSLIEDWEPKPDGHYWRGLDRTGVKVDIFIPNVNNWGLIFCLRTGSADFSTGIATRAKAIGRGFLNGHITINGLPVPTPEESDVFKLLGIQYVAPEVRHHAHQVKPLKGQRVPRNEWRRTVEVR